jgi:hypothetical protein
VLARVAPWAAAGIIAALLREGAPATSATTRLALAVALQGFRSEDIAAFPAAGAR